MVAFVSRSLALLTGLVLALPPCWCCTLTAERGTTPARQEQSATHSCCSPKQPPAPEPSPAPCAPQGPVKKCCERQTATQADSKWRLPDLPAFAAALLLPDLAPALPAVVLPVVGFDPDLPPVHVLHCVWLC